LVLINHILGLISYKSIQSLKKLKNQVFSYLIKKLVTKNKKNKLPFLMDFIEVTDGETS